MTVEIREYRLLETLKVIEVTAENMHIIPDYFEKFAYSNNGKTKRLLDRQGNQVYVGDLVNNKGDLTSPPELEHYFEDVTPKQKESNDDA